MPEVWSQVTDCLSDHFTVNVSVKVPVNKPCELTCVSIHKINAKSLVKTFYI